jgi:1-aminocyclopropane-1-carboxylate deaminase/D-cysteine desulfhydrase-like pyridoxal-dependent ACC family enzyme
MPSVVADPAELTPVELHDGRWYKRDDLFVPFDDVPISGGKVRQAMLLLGSKRDEIVERYGGVVLTATGVHSPQGLIIARVAAHFDLGCVVFVGATTVGGALMRHSMLRWATMCDATIDASARAAYEPALQAAAQRWRSEHDGAGYVVRFGINLDDAPEAIVESTAAQVANLPADVETIVVPVGAGITAGGVIVGAHWHRPQARVVCVQISGYERRDTIDPILERWLDGEPASHYDWHVIDDVPYAKHVERSVDGVALDPIYEAKAHDYMLAQLDLDAARSCFWLVGSSIAVRA